MAVYSRTNGWIGLVATSGLLLLCVLEGLGGLSPSAALWGFLGLAIGLQAVDDLLWQGSQDAVVVPLKKVAFGLVVVAGLWAAYAWLT